MKTILNSFQQTLAGTHRLPSRYADQATGRPPLGESRTRNAEVALNLREVVHGVRPDLVCVAKVHIYQLLLFSTFDNKIRLFYTFYKQNLLKSSKKLQVVVVF